MALDRKNFAGLSPEERIRKLRQLEEARKKEALEIEELIRASMNELKNNKLAGEIAPEQKAVDISRLFETPEPANIGKNVRGASRPAKAAQIYVTAAQLYQDYSQLKELYFIGGPNLTEEHLKIIGQIGERMNIAEKSMTESERITKILNPSKSILYKLQKETGLE